MDGGDNDRMTVVMIEKGGGRAKVGIIAATETERTPEPRARLISSFRMLVISWSVVLSFQVLIERRLVALLALPKQVFSRDSMASEGAKRP